MTPRLWALANRVLKRSEATRRGSPRGTPPALRVARRASSAISAFSVSLRCGFCLPAARRSALAQRRARLDSRPASATGLGGGAWWDWRGQLAGSGPADPDMGAPVAPRASVARVPLAGPSPGAGLLGCGPSGRLAHGRRPYVLGVGVGEDFGERAFAGPPLERRSTAGAGPGGPLVVPVVLRSSGRYQQPCYQLGDGLGIALGRVRMAGVAFVELSAPLALQWLGYEVTTPCGY